VATLRRELISKEYMQREKGIYWLTPDDEKEA
jgi:hypothetical protein